MVREGLRAVLVHAGHEVVGEAGDPTRALAAILSLAPEVVVLDLHLGLRSGLELLEELQKRHHASRVILLTMSDQPHHVAEAMRLGAAAYVLKGAPSSELLLAIETVLAGRRHLGSEVADLAVQGLTSGDEQHALSLLSARERQIVLMVVRGRSSSEIGTLLHLSPKTVDSYRSRLMAKLGVADVPALVRLAVRTGLIDAQER